jgi:two-component system sensor histidine kinase CiaH
MFHSARIKLTLLYVIIVAIVSVSFSGIIYHDVSLELERGFQVAELRLQNTLPIFVPRRTVALSLLSDEFESARRFVLLRLIAVNSVIITLSGFAAYFLAGKTLRPIEAAVEEQKRFVADASHELRTPLTAIKTEIEVALRDKKMTTKEAKQLLGSNLEEVEKMQALTNYLLSLSRYEAGNIKLAKTEINLSDLVTKATEKYQSAAQDKGVALSTKISEVNVKANATSIEELVSIILDNAIKYTPQGGNIKVTLRPKGKGAILAISDTGVGIKASDLPYIFNRFYRADSSRNKTKTDGYGLGLSIAKSIVAAHQGTIDVESTPLKGTTFKVIIP